jgi:hypothetical protein
MESQRVFIKLAFSRSSPFPEAPMTLPHAGRNPLYHGRCLGKILERVVTSRLLWYVETKNLAYSMSTKLVSGLSVVRGPYSQPSWHNNKHLVDSSYILSVMLDFDEAYILWSGAWAVFVKLKNIGLHGKIFRYIVNLYSDTLYIKVRVGDELSNPFLMENGIIREWAISPLLFIIKINKQQIFTWGRKSATRRWFNYIKARRQTQHNCK